MSRRSYRAGEFPDQPDKLAPSSPDQERRPGRPRLSPKYQYIPTSCDDLARGLNYAVLTVFGWMLLAWLLG